MFPYDARLAAAVQETPLSINGVVDVLREIDAACADGDGLKWFNWLYLQVTLAVRSRVAAGGFNDGAWLADLDVRFAALYFNALSAVLAGQPCPGCWQAMFSVRGQAETCRIQFALAGMNAHINRDLPVALLAACNAAGVAPEHGTTHYDDYTALNTTLDGLIDLAKKTLNVRLLGAVLPPASHLEDTIAAWNLAAGRENAWMTAQSLWHQPDALAAAHLDIIDGLTTVIGKVLLVPVP